MQALLDQLAPGDEEYAIARAIDPARLPAHIAIIMDGNGRWAGRRHLPRVAGHKAGVQSVRTTVETCAQLGIQALTLYAFSVENWKRPRTEVDMLWRLLRIYLGAELPEMMKHGIRFSAIGRLEALPGFVRAELDSVIRKTGNNRGLLLNLAINYGGRAEIVDAVKALVEEALMFGRKRKPSDFKAEVEAHLELEAERLKEQGLSDEEARAAARRAFGNVGQVQERFYESSRWVSWDQLWQDLR